MPGFDSSGNYSRWYNWQTDAANNVKIQADRHDQEDDGFATGLSTCITKDGRTQPTADIPMNGKKLVNLGTPTVSTDAANKFYVDNSTGRARISDGPPASPVAGDLWWESDSGNLYCYYNDGDSLQWVQANTPATVAIPDYVDVKTAQPYSRVVNGAMQVSQENGVTASTAQGYYAADQWIVYNGSAAVVSAQLVASRTPKGSTTRLRYTVTTADAAIAAGDYYQILQMIEGARTADFMWGLATARQVILRFGFKAPAGTYCARLTNGGGTRTYIASFIIAAGQANTDTEQVFVIPGDVTGTWATDTTIGVQLGITIAAGTTHQGVAGWNAGNLQATAAITNNLAAVNNIFELYDVGLYLDPDATGKAPPWQMPDFASELAACMRYWEYFNDSILHANIWSTHYFKVIKRVIPALAFSTTPSGAAAQPMSFNASNPTTMGFTCKINARL